MSVTTGVESHRTIPTKLSAVVHARIHEFLAALGDSENYKVQHYAGEFLAEDNLNQLKASVQQFPHIMYDVEVIEELETDNTQTMPEDSIAFIIFCCVSNAFDASIQWASSYELAWDVRAAFQGLEIEATAGFHGNAFFEPQSIERELHVPGMSVHTLRLDVRFVHDSKGSINP